MVKRKQLINQSGNFLFKGKNTHISLNPIKLNNYHIEQTSDIKFLGIYIDEMLIWKNHLNYITTKLSKMTGLLLKACKRLTTKSLLLYYIIFVYPYLIF